ncbi:chloride channel protein [Nocardioides endophyticus]|uniref:Chloride channel protein n=1 Tax=Nocardioides endophyticus TaxID=1353775 RepID=A0ABP8ZCD4_9ACTN
MTSEAVAGPDLHNRRYLALLGGAALLGIPLSLVAFLFLAAVHELEHLLWHSLPHELGYAEPPAWWAIAALGLGGVLVGLAVRYLPGHGGHVPADGFSAGGASASAVPGVVLAAGAGLALGAVVGPEAPLIALGGGLALLAIRWTRFADDPQATMILSGAGSAAAISAIFGNPLIAAILFLEIVGLARRQATLVLLPCLVASGVGAVLFTGLGDWTGFGIGSLAIPDLEATGLSVGDVVLVFPLAAAVSVVTWVIFGVGKRVAVIAGEHVLAGTIGAGLVAGCGAALYAVLTDHSPAEVALSGQATLGTLASSPDSWSTGALVALIVLKGVAYAVCLGAFRGGPAFPAIFLGAAIGVLAFTLVPSVELVPALAIGMAAGVAVIGLPITSVLLVVLLLGDAAASQMPVVILAAVVALVVGELLTTYGSRRQTQESAVAAATAP